MTSPAVIYFPFSTLALTLWFLPFHIAAKIMTRDYKPHLKESLYLIAAALVGSFFFNLNRLLTRDTAFTLHIIEDIAMFVVLFIYFTKIKFYTKEKGIILSTITSLIIIAFTFAWDAVAYTFFPNFLLGIVSPPIFLQTLPFVLFVYIVYIAFPLLFVRLTRGLRVTVNKNEHFQKTLATLSICIFLFFQIVLSAWREQGYLIHFFSWQMILLTLLIISIFISFFFYTRSLTERMALQQKDADQEHLKEYLEQIESHQRIVERISHDMGNVLSSIEGYLAAGNLTGLREYFYCRIKPITTGITEDTFALARLNNIKALEIKAILARKITEAQSAGIDTTLEVTDEIDDIPINSVALVRMLGIILDNAIEELTILGKGQLMIACYKFGGGLTFIVQNTCRPDIQKLHTLKQAGFSTKGEGRGLGLSNLTEIAESHSSNITLQTSIADGNFTQRLRIGGGITS